MPEQSWTARIRAAVAAGRPLYVTPVEWAAIDTFRGPALSDGPPFLTVEDRRAFAAHPDLKILVKPSPDNGPGEEDPRVVVRHEPGSGWPETEPYRQALARRAGLDDS